MTKIRAIMAMDINGGIGKDNSIPWNIPQEMAFFKETTMGAAVIMGRRTYESIPGGLKGRLNIVLTRDVSKVIAPAIGVSGVSEALDIAHRSSPKGIYVIGGARTYIEMEPVIEEFIISVIPESYDCDTFAKPLDEKTWGKGRLIKAIPYDDGYGRSRVIEVRKYKRQ